MSLDRWRPEVLDRPYDALAVGDSAVYGSVTITEEQVRTFVGLTGDDHPLHLDAAYAARSRYGQRITPGFLVLSLAFGLIPARPETALAFYGMDQVRFLRPTHLGDVLRARLRILDRTDKGVGGLIAGGLEVLNQRDETVATAVLTVLLADAAHAESALASA